MKIIQIAGINQEIYGLDEQGNLYRLFKQLLESSNATDYRWIKVIDKDKFK